MEEFPQSGPDVGGCVWSAVKYIGIGILILVLIVGIAIGYGLANGF